MLTSLRCPSTSRKETAADLFGQEGRLKSFVVVLRSVILRATLFILSFRPDTASTFPGQISLKDTQRSLRRPVGERCEILVGRQNHVRQQQKDKCDLLRAFFVFGAYLRTQKEAKLQEAMRKDLLYNHHRSICLEQRCLKPTVGSTSLPLILNVEKYFKKRESGILTQDGNYE